MPDPLPAISDLPLWATATLMLVVSTLVAGLAPWLVRRGLGFERRKYKRLGGTSGRSGD